MKKNKVVIIIVVALVILMAISTISYAKSGTVFGDLGFRLKNMIADKENDKILTTVNGKPIYISNIKARVMVQESTKQENIKILENMILSDEDDEVKKIYESKLNELKQKSIEPQDIVRETIKEMLVLNECEMFKLSVDKDKIEKELLATFETLESLSNQGNQEAINSLGYMKDYYDSLGVTQAESIDMQIDVLVRQRLIYLHETYIVENNFGIGMFNPRSEEQKEYYLKYCESLLSDSDIKFLIDIDGIDFSEN